MTSKWTIFGFWLKDKREYLIHRREKTRGNLKIRYYENTSTGFIGLIYGLEEGMVQGHGFSKDYISKCEYFTVYFEAWVF